MVVEAAAAAAYWEAWSTIPFPWVRIGKEANRWEEQFYLGANPEAQVDYGTSETELTAYAVEVRGRSQQFSSRELSREAGVSVGTVSGFVRGRTTPSIRIVRAIDCAASRIALAGRQPSGLGFPLPR